MFCSNSLTYSEDNVDNCSDGDQNDDLEDELPYLVVSDDEDDDEINGHGTPRVRFSLVNFSTVFIMRMNDVNDSDITIWKIRIFNGLFLAHVLGQSHTVLTNSAL